MINGPGPRQSIETGVFDYVNLHYQFVGSYTASGSGSSATGGNYEALVAAQKHDMGTPGCRPELLRFSLQATTGVFIISATDKGGALYEPPRKLYSVHILF